MNASIHKDFDRERFSKHFVYESYDDETQLFFNRGSIGFVLLACPLAEASVSAQNEIAEFLKSDENLPAESSLQVLMIGSNNIENFLSNWQSYRKGEIFIELANKRTEFLRDQAQKVGSIKDVVLLISVTIPNLNANIDDMIRRRDALKDTFRSMKAKQSASAFCSMLRRSGWYFVPCKYDHVAVLLAALPMQLVEQGPKGILGQKTSGVGVALSSLGRGIKTVSVESKVLLPIIGEWKGDLSSPGMLLAGRRGQIMYWSPFGGALLPALNKHGVAPNENFNLCIAGVPGSGKSVFMQELMLSVLGVGGKVFVLDYGRSFKRTCLILGGSYIEFDMKNPVSINPFSEVPEDDSAKSIEARSDFLSNFPSILATMAAPQYGTSDLQQPMLQRALISVWQKKGAKAEITDIADWLSNREESYAKELGNMLFPFTKDGQHGRFFSGKAQLSLNSDIVVIETDHLRSVPELLAAIVQIMIVHINQTMVKGDRSRPFLIMIDEAWNLLAGKRSGEFIEKAGRIARKYNGSIALATQQLTDYFRQEGSASEKAFKNSSHKIILKQNSESFKAMRANPKLAGFVDEDWKLNLLQSVHSNPPYYSEIAIYSPNVSGVIGRLMIDPFTLLLTSTNARDYQATAKNEL
ncbi:TraC family protein [Orientia tsutsugamushi]|uniref:TraG/VirB4 family ATPase n=1 Tax=Orientia tsutsugamushi TaxID=784 RepID=UPI00352970FB